MTSTLYRRVPSADGVHIAVYESGTPDGPAIVAIHGYPDNHTVWDGVAALLGERYRVVTYDVRGCGQSDQPAGCAPYRMQRLVDDLVAVLDAVSPDRRVHLLAHDWGSVQAWPALVDPRVEGRVASFVSISGPSIGHAGAYFRRGLSHPGKTLRQLADSYYVALFQLPRLPEAAARSGFIDRATRRMAARHGAVDALPRRDEHDMVNGIQLYRANILGGLRRPEPEQVTVPVLVLAPRHDPHVTVALQTEAPQPYVDDLRTTVLEGGHWIVSQRPDVIARAVADFHASLSPAS